MWTKRQLINSAFEEIGLASYAFDITPEEADGCLRRLDAMMALWESQGIRLGYHLPGSPQFSDEDDDSGLPDQAAEAVYTNLGIKIAPTYGKVVSIETKAAARAGFNAVMSKFSVIPEQQLPGTLPIGQGNKWFRGNTAYGPFFRPAQPALLAGEDSILDVATSPDQPEIN